MRYDCSLRPPTGTKRSLRFRSVTKREIDISFFFPRFGNDIMYVQEGEGV